MCDRISANINQAYVRTRTNKRIKVTTVIIVIFKQDA